MAPERPPSPLCISVTVPAATPLGAPHQAADVDGASVSGAPDDELTSLSWLQDRNLLRGINLCNKTQITSETEQLNGDIKDEPMGPSPTSDYLEDSCVSEDNNTQNSSSDQSISFTIADNVNNNNINKNHNIIDDYRYEYRYKNGDYRTKEISYNYSPMKSVKQSSPIKQKHPSNVPYDPLVHTTNKPPYSFSCLIFMAIEDSSAKALPVKEIYAWIVAHFPYFKNAPTGWKNSVRHNLSLNKCFQKVEKAPPWFQNLGKGSLWMVDEKFRPNLLQALTRSPFHPCSTLDPATYRSPTKVALTKESPPQPHKSGARLPNPELFPFLSRRLAASEMHSETPITDAAPVRINWNTSSWSTTDRSTVIDSRNTQTWTAESLEDVNAATVMLALKHGPRMFIEGLGQTGGVPVITSSPSEDHTYSAGGTDGHEALRGDSATSGGSGGSGSPDAAYESDDSQSLQMSHSDMEEQRRIAEGADALLNLARICGRSSSPVYSQKHNIQTTRYPIYEQHADNTEPRTRFKPRLLQRRPKRRPSPSEVRTKQHYDYVNNNNNGFPESKRLKYEWSQD